MPTLQVHFVPSLVDPAELTGSVCVVIDVLRATTTMIHALAAGAAGIVPCLTIDAARECAAAFPAGSAVLGGERGGLPIPGFALGNSPAEFTNESVGGRTVVLTTTNGTKALLYCNAAADVLIAGFVNLSAVCAVLQPIGQAPGTATAPTRVDVVCAGTDGQVTREDVLLAGAIVERLTGACAWDINDEAALARDAWTAAVAGTSASEVESRLVEALPASLGGRNLVALNMDHDIALAAQLDHFAIVPRYRAACGGLPVGLVAVG